MRSNTYYYNLERASDTQTPEREKLETQIKEYLAKGGKIKHVPLGSSAAMPITDHDPRKKK